MSAAVESSSHSDWIEGWNFGVTAAMGVLRASDLPIEISEHAVELVGQLLTD